MKKGLLTFSAWVCVVLGLMIWLGAMTSLGQCLIALSFIAFAALLAGVRGQRVYLQDAIYAAAAAVCVSLASLLFLKNTPQFAPLVFFAGIILPGKILFKELWSQRFQSWVQNGKGW